MLIILPHILIYCRSSEHIRNRIIEIYEDLDRFIVSIPIFPIVFYINMIIMLTDYSKTGVFSLDVLIERLFIEEYIQEQEQS